MKIRAYATLRDLTGAGVLDRELPGAETIGDVLHALSRAYPELSKKLWDAEGRPRGFVTVFVNGRSIEYLQGLQTPVSEADAISLFPPVGGG